MPDKSVSWSISRFVHVLGMTGSVHDAEALAALRTANRMMREAGLSWHDVIETSKNTQQGPPTATMARPDQVVVAADGTRLSPPIGPRWLDTILYLLPLFQDRGSFEDATFLGSLPQKLTRRRISEVEALRVCTLYSDVARRPQWTPR